MEEPAGFLNKNSPRKRRNRDEPKVIPSQLPDEIVDEILTRLPVKSLLRFKCICKRWLFTISNPNFHKRKLKSVLLTVSSHNDYTTFYSINNADPAFINPFSMSWSYDKVWFRQDPIVSNSCNGLVLISFGVSVFLFNPSTRYSIKVLTLDRLQDFAVMGLCYDAYANDYKAVVCMDDESPELGSAFVLVASLKSKQWIGVGFPFDACTVMEGPVVDGQMHWTVLESTDDDASTDKKIIRFDPRTNKFHDFPSPLSKFGGVNAIVGLGDPDGRLWMARGDNRYNFQAQEGDVEILVMKEYGVVESWTTVFVLSNLGVNPYYGNLIPFLITKHRELLLMLLRYDIISPGKVLAYNPRTKSYRTILEIPLPDYVFHGTSLVESLVSPADYRWDPIRHSKLGGQINWQKSDSV